MYLGLLIRKYAEELLTRQILLSLLSKYKRPNDKINELVKDGSLTPLKKDLYIPGPKLNIQRPEPFIIANHLWGPDYVSLGSALSHWGFIPERVYEISSVTIKMHALLFRNWKNRVKGRDWYDLEWYIKKECR